MKRLGLIDPPPPSLAGAPLDIEFVSMLALAQRAAATAGMERLIGLVGNMAAIFPQVKDNVDQDTFIREFNDLLGNPNKIMRGPQDVAALRQQAAQRAAATADGIYHAGGTGGRRCGPGGAGAREYSGRCWAQCPGVGPRRQPAMTETTEAEMVERLVGGARHAADCVQSMCASMRMGMPPQPRVLIQFRQWMKDASGSAGQLAHAQQNPAYLGLRDQMEATVPLVMNAAMSRDARAGLMLAKTGAILDKLWRTAAQTAVAKPVARQDVLAMLDERKAQVH